MGNRKAKAKANRSRKSQKANILSSTKPSPLSPKFLKDSSQNNLNGKWETEKTFGKNSKGCRCNFDFGPHSPGCEAIKDPKTFAKKSAKFSKEPLTFSKVEFAVKMNAIRNYRIFSKEPLFR